MPVIPDTVHDPGQAREDLPSAGSTLLSNSAIAAAGTLVSALLSGAYVFLGARWLGPVDYGSVAATIALAYVLFLALDPLETGLTLRVAALAGRAQLDGLRSFAAQALRGILAVAVTLLCAWLALAPLVAGEMNSAPGTLEWLGVFFCVSLATCIPRAVLWGRELFRTLSANLALESATRFVVGLSLIALVGGPGAMVAGYGLAMVVALCHGSLRMFAGLPAREHGLPSPRVSWADAAHPLRALSVPLVGVNLYSALTLNADVIAAKHYLDPTAAGLYAGSGSVARLVYMGAGPILSVLFSRLAALNASGGDTRTLVRQVSAVVLSALALSLVVPALSGDFVLRLALGEAYVDAGEVLFYQWAAVCVITAQAFFAHFMLATKTVRGAWLFIIPCSALLLGLTFWHGSSLEIAQVTLIACAGPGLLTYLVLWRISAPNLAVS